MRTGHKKAVLWKRVRRISGQVDAIERALVSDAECGAVLQLVAAVRGATDGLMREILEEHIHRHLADRSAPSIDRGTAVIEVLRRYLK